MRFEQTNISMNSFFENVATVGSGLISFLIVWTQGIIEANQVLQVFCYAAVAALGGLFIKFAARFITWAFRRIIYHDKTKFFKYKL